MTQERRYRLQKQTLAILKDRHTTVTVPVGEILTVVENVFKNERLIDVIWDGQIYAMFAQDLHERGEFLDAAAEP